MLGDQRHSVVGRVPEVSEIICEVLPLQLAAARSERTGKAVSGFESTGDETRGGRVCGSRNAFPYRSRGRFKATNLDVAVERIATLESSYYSPNATFSSQEQLYGTLRIFRRLVNDENHRSANKRLSIWASSECFYQSNDARCHQQGDLLQCQQRSRGLKLGVSGRHHSYPGGHLFTVEADEHYNRDVQYTVGGLDR
jgi:hypothetical protein